MSELLRNAKIVAARACAAGDVPTARAIFARALRAGNKATLRGFKGQLMPTELRTAEIDMLPVWIRERSFFMAGVNRVEVLEEFDDRVRRVAEGELTVQEARQELRESLDRLGYEPEPGQKGTIKDLRSVRRMNVALETNVAMIHGYERWERQQRVLGSFPAQRFVRQRIANEPRKDWPQRFAAAVAETNEAGANVPEMCALVNHPCWVKLSRFGTPYAPFDFGSGMGLVPLSLSEATELDLMPATDSAPEHSRMMEPQTRSLNESLEASPAITEQAFRDAVAEYLQGFAEWDGKRLVFTDPNGTRPYTAEALAQLWQRPLPAAFADLPGGGHVQREAFFEWVRNHAAFVNAGGRDKWTMLLMLHRRLVNTTPPPALYRGLKVSDEKIEKLLRNVESAGYGPLPNKPVESWTQSLAAARHFAAGHGWAVILTMPKPPTEAFKDVSTLVRKFSREIGKVSQPPVQTEAEWLLGLGWRFRASNVVRDAEHRMVHITLQYGRGMR